MAGEETAAAAAAAAAATAATSSSRTRSQADSAMTTDVALAAKDGGPHKFSLRQNRNSREATSRRNTRQALKAATANSGSEARSTSCASAS